MVSKVPLTYVFLTNVLVCVAGFAVVVCRAPLQIAMPIFAVEIVFGVVVLLRAVTEWKVARAQAAGAPRGP